MVQLITTLGPYRAGQLGMILPHEHIFVDLGPIEAENWRAARADDVIPVMKPELERLRKAGGASCLRPAARRRALAT